MTSKSKPEAKEENRTGYPRTLWFPGDLWETLVATAKAADRTTSREAVRRLRASFAAEGTTI